MRRSLMVLCLLLAVAPWAAAQDPAAVDAGHYEVVFENDSVRALRISYGPGEKSVMHFHPDGLAVFLTDLKVQFTMPDGSTATAEAKAGEARWIQGGHHLPENLSSEPFELILVEIKGGEDEGGDD